MRRFVPTCVFIMFVALLGCNEEEARYEEVEKLRALGVATTPLVSEPSAPGAPSIVSLVIHAAVPKGSTVTAEPYEDLGSKYAATIPITIDPAPPTLSAHAAFDLAEFKASAAIPSAELLPIPPDPGFARLRYGIRLVSGDESENVVGTLLVYPKGAAELQWNLTPPSSVIEVPQASSVFSGDQDLRGAITNPIGEPMRVAWFVSAGKVRNRRARETVWTTKDVSGQQTVVFTVRGNKSGAFTFQAVDVTVE